MTGNSILIHWKVQANSSGCERRNRGLSVSKWQGRKGTFALLWASKLRNRENNLPDYPYNLHDPPVTWKIIGDEFQRSNTLEDASNRYWQLSSREIAVDGD